MLWESILNPQRDSTNESYLTRIRERGNAVHCILPHNKGRKGVEGGGTFVVHVCLESFSCGSMPIVH